MIVLAAGGLIVSALSAAHYLSPIARRLAAGSEVDLVLLGGGSPVLFVYHPFSKTVNAVRLPGRTARAGSAYQRAGEVLKAFYGPGAPVREPAYLEVPETDPDAFEGVLNNWRARPAVLAALVRRLYELKRTGATNLSSHDLALLALELSRMNSSDLIREDLDRVRSSVRPGPAETEGTPAQVPQAVRLEVLNASGRKDLAVLATKFLRAKGFDVINFGTYGGAQKATRIESCPENIEAARGVRDALGLGGLEIYSRPGQPAIAQVRIILGADFDAVKIEKTERGIK